MSFAASMAWLCDVDAVVDADGFAAVFSIAGTPFSLSPNDTAAVSIKHPNIAS